MEAASLFGRARVTLRAVSLYRTLQSELELAGDFAAAAQICDRQAVLLREAHEQRSAGSPFFFYRVHFSADPHGSNQLSALPADLVLPAAAVSPPSTPADPTAGSAATPEQMRAARQSLRFATDMLQSTSAAAAGITGTWPRSYIYRTMERLDAFVDALRDAHPSAAVVPGGDEKPVSSGAGTRAI
jgi:hypothetical protein